MAERTTSPTAGSRRVAVTSDRSLVAESVAAALSTWDIDVVVLGWPGGGVRRLPDLAREVAAGLLVCDLDSAESLRGAQLVLAHRPPRWIVLTSAPRGPLWGAMGEAGAAHVLASSTGLEATADALGRLARDELRPDADLVAQQSVWRGVGPDLAVVTGRLALLGAREVALLRQLHAGLSVTEVAAAWGVPDEEVLTLHRRMLAQLRVATDALAIEAWDTVTQEPAG